MNDQNKDVDDSLDTLVDQLISGGGAKNTAQFPVQLSPEVVINEEDIQQFVIRKAATSVTETLDAIRKLIPKVTSGQIPEEMESLSKLISSNNDTILLLNSIATTNKNNKFKIELEKFKFDEKAKLIQVKSKANHGGITMTREEMLKLVFGEKNDVVEVDGEITEENNQNEK